MNIIQIQNDLKNVSDQALINYVQNPTGHVPSFLALGELQRRKDMRAEYVKNNPPKSTVAQDLEQQSTPASGLAMLAKNPHLGAPASQGVANLPTGEMFSEKNFATGGIVAFADNQDQPVSSDMPGSGIATSRFSRWWEGVKRRGQTNLSLDDQIQKLQNEYLSLLELYYNNKLKLMENKESETGIKQYQTDEVKKMLNFEFESRVISLYSSR